MDNCLVISTDEPIVNTNIRNRSVWCERNFEYNYKIKDIENKLIPGTMFVTTTHQLYTIGFVTPITNDYGDEDYEIYCTDTYRCISDIGRNYKILQDRVFILDINEAAFAICFANKASELFNIKLKEKEQTTYRRFKGDQYKPFRSSRHTPPVSSQPPQLNYRYVCMDHLKLFKNELKNVDITDKYQMSYIYLYQEFFNNILETIFRIRPTSLEDKAFIVRHKNIIIKYTKLVRECTSLLYDIFIKEVTQTE